MIRKALFYLFFISALAFFYVTCSDVHSAKKVYQGKVVKVTDGDSITILHEGKEFRIRLAEIDAPERGQPFWRKSKDALTYYIAGNEVEVFEVNIDRYRHVVRQMYLGDFWIHGASVRGGYVYI